MDEDKDGKLDVGEIKRALEKMGLRPSIQEIKDLMKKADANNNGTIEIEEFGQLWQSVKSNEYADQVGGIAKLNTLRMQDLNKYPEPSNKWKKVGDSGYHGTVGGGVYKKDKKAPPPKKSISDLP
eukprot:TRINITY_DN12505_c0_g1_i1.p1 TRINITY_DN12505_c0_g1~~TRINITY_DN12505_c0_g1_i1.p1  ORF type:complete len:140 (-),score=50.67 TRINITY_DN12505_c0_g1_i1:132-506(-)